MPGSLRLGKIFGIAIEVNYSWLIILVLLTWSLAVSWFPAMYGGWSLATYWVTALISALLLFASVIAHELAHSVVARARGLPVRSITLFVFGGVSNLEREPASAGVEFVMAFVGPLTSLVIGGIAWPIGLALQRGTPLRAVLVYLGFTNVLLGVFNLIPGFPLDGGRVLRSIVWGATGNLRTATRWAARVGDVIAVLFILVGIWFFFIGDFIGGIWLGFIGWFLLQASLSANTQVQLQALLRGSTVAQIMNPNPVTVPPYISIQTLVDEHILSQGLRAVAVVQLDRLVGLITLRDVRHVPRDEWGRVTVGDVMIPREKLVVVRPDQDLNDVLPLMIGQDINQLPVVDGDRLLGMLSRDRLLHFIEVRRGLGVDLLAREERQPWPPQRGEPPPLSQGPTHEGSTGASEAGARDPTQLPHVG
jgi:Zn-dependent protease/CBS domain-containing protein